MIVGVHGPRRAGKSTVARILRELYGFEVRQFSAPLKAAARELFGWTDEYTDGPRKELVDPDYGVSPRQVMQHLGTEWGQYALPAAFPRIEDTVGHRMLWVTIAMRGYDESCRWAFSDLRFPHEWRAITDRGGLIIRVERHHEPDASDAHESERHELPYDVLIRNDGSEVQLLREVSRLPWRLTGEENRRLEADRTNTVQSA